MKNAEIAWYEWYEPKHDSKTSDTGKSFKPSPLGDGQSKALSSFSCPKKSNKQFAVESLNK